MNNLKTIYKTLAIFLILLITVSAVSAGCNGKAVYCKQKYYKGNCYGENSGYSKKCTTGNCGYSGKMCKAGKFKPVRGCVGGVCGKGRGNTSVDPATPINGSGVTVVKLCRNNACTVGGNGKVLTLTNYNNATDPAYDQLVSFLKEDKTDEHPYTNGYVCSDFARTLHNNAEKAGIRSGWVGVRSCNHAFNVFNTTDRGLVYIDCTGQPGGGAYLDKELNCVVGQPLTGYYLFKDGTVDMGCAVSSPLVYW